MIIVRDGCGIHLWTHSLGWTALCSAYAGHVMRVLAAQEPAWPAGAGIRPGRAVVYMAESIALAVLENLVHTTRQDFEVEPKGWTIFERRLDGVTG